ncbi:MAG: CDP-alcohol phosphatidyltransferase family protein [Alphaproteobacteria bacterium]|nr:CDP-alcohol phosphatidyltransferase family protein [Alphaproteobacteria bacterium]MBV9692892.1 CDP-alcohol phosphatidyltransferase family protein [Alphaproteobacteria bacterium]
MNPMLRHLPNLLTALRLCAAPFTAYLILGGRDWAALAVFAFAGLSDALDGYLARRLAPDSRFGAYLDPAADKLLMLASFVTLTMMGAVPFWLTALVIGRDVAIVACVGLSWLLAIPLRIEPLAVGKVSTVVQVGFIALVLLLRAFDLESPGAVEIAAVATAAVTVASWLAYAQIWFRAMALGRRAA